MIIQEKANLMVVECLASVALVHSESFAMRLDRYARDTMSTLLAMSNPDTGLPANRVVISADSNILRTRDTTPTDIGFVIADLIAGTDMGIVEPALANAQISRILTSLDSMSRQNGLFYNWYDTDTCAITTTHHSGGGSRTIYLNCR